MKSFTAFLFIFLYFNTLLAQNKLNQGTLVTKNFIETIPIEMSSSKIIIPVEINGKIRRFFLDTGAPLVISKELQKELALSTTKGTLTDINERKDSTEYADVPSLKIGKVEFQNTKAIVFDLTQGLFACFQIDGFIGSNLLRNSIIQINSNTKEVILTDNIKSLGNTLRGGMEMQLDANQSTPLIKVFLSKNVTETLVFDTGDDSFYSLSIRNFNYFVENTDLERFIVDHGKGASNIGVLGLEADTTKYMMKLEFLGIDKMEFHNLLVNTDVSDNSRIGAKLLDYAIVTVDYPSKRFYVNPFTRGENEVDAYNPGFGFELKPENGLIKVGLVWEKSKAYEKGVRHNDILRKVDDYVLEGKQLCELYFKLHDLGDKIKQVSLEFEDENGQTKLIELEKE